MSDDFSMDELIRELDRQSARIRISIDFRRFKKPVTMISGIQDNKNALEIAKKLKTKIGTGGTFKHGQIMLQGDHRETAKNMLVSMGYAEDSIEVM